MFAFYHVHGREAKDCESYANLLTQNSDLTEDVGTKVTGHTCT